MKHKFAKIQALLFAVFLLFCSRAHGDTINFEGLADGTSVSSYYAGVLFANATVVTAGLSLNELEFPPRSGQNVAFDDGGPISIAFTTPVSAFSAYFTYAEPLLISAFDTYGNLLGSAVSAFSENFTSSGNPANELLSLSFSQDIGSVLLSGDPSGGSFIVDDVSYTPAAGTPTPPMSVTPEPSSLLLLGTGLFAMVAPRLARAGRAVKVHGLSRS